jgi:signal transduction histidine kinase
VATCELRFCALDGRDRELLVSAAPLRDLDGHLTGAVIVLHDQTEQQRLAREREAAQANELAAERIAAQMSAFLVTAAHDIRSPLTIASTRVQLAERLADRLADRLAAVVAAAPPTPLAAAGGAEPPTLLAERVVDNVHRARAGIQNLNRMVDVLFDVTQAHAQQLALDLAPCDLGALVREHVAAEQVAPGGHRLQVEAPDEAALVEADADRLDQVLTNFLSNALKYSPADQPVTVRLEVVDHQAVVYVTDHGPGISPEEQSHIWDMFYRSPTIPVQPGNSAVKGSLGLGLHICKQLVELHPGGSIGVESTVGYGSTFWFRLPLVS